MERMDLGIRPSLDNPKEIQKVKDIIDACFLGLYKSNDVEEGGGRDVLFLDNYVVKFPKEGNNEFVSGTSQNLKELEVYMSTKHKSLVPVYGSHLGCIICKKVNDTPLDVYMSKYNLSESEAYKKLDKDILDKLRDLHSIIMNHSLAILDMSKHNSWGYDKDLDDIVCLDYGLNQPKRESYIKVLNQLDDKDLMQYFTLAEDIIKNFYGHKNPSVDKRPVFEKELLKVFKVAMAPITGAQLIMEEVNNRGLGKIKELNYEDAKSIVLNEIPNEEIFKSKRKLGNYGATITLDCFGFEVNIFNEDYENAVKYLTQKLKRYRDSNAFR